MFDSSANAYGVAIVAAYSVSTAIQFLYGGTYLGAITQVSATTPWAWAVSDQLLWSIAYEAA